MKNIKEQKRKFDKNIWYYFLPEIKRFRKNLIALSIFACLTAGIDIGLSYMTKYAIDVFIKEGSFKNIGQFSLMYVVLISLLGICIFFFISNGGKVEAGLSYRIHKRGFKKIQELSMSYFDKNAIGWIMARMTSDVTKLGEFISWSLVDMVWGLTLMIGMFIVMCVVNLKLTFITLAITPILIFVSFYFQKKIVGLQRSVRKFNSKITGAINEGITGAKTTKTLSTEDICVEDFEEMTEKMKGYSIKSSKFASMFQPVVINLAAIGTVMALYYGGNGIIKGTVEYGTLVLFINFSVQFFEPVRELAAILTEMQSAQVAAERVHNLLDAKSDIVEKEEVISRYGSVTKPKKENFEKLNGDIEFKNVSFCYNKDEWILENLNLKFKKGQSIALIGETGSGKSTIVNLICRFYENQKGIIEIDGEDIRNRSEAWLHNNIGYVLQTPHLFSGTIKENIRYGNLSASDEEIILAAKRVNADKFIEKLEGKYEAQVGEGGSLLSSGQKQLISFARAILANPKLFILDEATSAIDTETEMEIQRALETVLENRTSFIIAHRLSTIRSCDRIIVIEKGKVIEDGNHNSLMKDRGHYYKLYTNQYIEEKEEEMLA